MLRCVCNDGEGSCGERDDRAPDGAGISCAGVRRPPLGGATVTVTLRRGRPRNLAPAEASDARTRGAARYETQHVSKAFGGAVALSDVSVAFEPGEIHTLCGENGAGKSTLLKVLAGIHQPDKGEILLGDEPLSALTPRAAQLRGIYLVPQEPTLMANLSALENLFVGILPRGPLPFSVDRKRMERSAGEFFHQVGLEIDPREPASSLSIAQQQLLECARALAHSCNIIFFDEPTSPLTSREADVLFALMRQLRERKFTLGFISHRLDEVLAISDRITVLRDSRVVTEFQPQEATREKLVEAMVGHDIAVRQRRQRDLSSAETVLEVQALTTPGRFSDVSFVARRGEVLGLAGLVGSGRTEIAEAIFGLRLASGSVTLAGRPLPHRTPASLINAGLIYLPEDRGRHGVFAEVDLERNITAAIVPKLPRHGPLLRPSAEYQIAEKASERTRIVARSLAAPIKSLSGGNQQRAMFSRWLLAEPRVAIFDEPTRGVDVGAKEDIYKIIDGISASGIAVLMISSELEELVLVCDRVIAIYEGRRVAEVVGDDITLERLGTLIVGEQVK
jgi:ABC-type sugar transport system ATPase subunit